MAEAFGIVSGAVSTAAVLTACFDCFGSIQLGRRFGSDFQTRQLQVDCARLRLARWGRSVNIYEDPSFSSLSQSPPHEVQKMKETLFKILMLFEDVQRRSERYQVTGQVEGEDSNYSATDVDQAFSGAHNKMQDLAIRRQRETGILKKMTWVLQDASVIKELIQDVTCLIESLEKLSPAETHVAREQLALSDTEALGDRRTLRVTTEAAYQVDPLLSETCRRQMRLSGHFYSSMFLTQSAKVLSGDYFSVSWNRGVSGACHSYNGVKVEGQVKAQFGNSFGGKSFFED